MILSRPVRVKMSFMLSCGTTSVSTMQSWFRNGFRHILDSWPSTFPHTLLVLNPIDLSVSSAPPPPAPLVTVAPSDKQTELLTVLQWELQCENLVPQCFYTILDTEGHQMVIKYSMEGFIKYKKKNTVGNSKREFTDHNASGRSLNYSRSSRSWMTNMQDQTCSCIAGNDYISFNQFNMERHWNVDPNFSIVFCVFDLHCTRCENNPLLGLHVNMDSITLS